LSDSWKQLNDMMIQLGVDSPPVDAWKAFYDELVEMNQNVNLTRIESEDDAILKHFLDTYLLYSMLKNEACIKDISTALDFGTGGGVPGIPFLMLHGSLKALYLVDARKKKLDCLAGCAKRLGLSQVYCVHDNWNPVRSKAWGRLNQRIDLIMARAVGETGMLVKTLAPLRAKYMLFPKGPSLTEDELSAANGFAKSRGYNSVLRQDVEIEFHGQKMNRTLLLWKLT
jgi:16S rRNA (guanine527-N7)-methyltransferase